VKVRREDTTVALIARAPEEAKESVKEAALQRMAQACLWLEMEITWHESQLALIRSQIESIDVNQN